MHRFVARAKVVLRSVETWLIVASGVVVAATPAITDALPEGWQDDAAMVSARAVSVIAVAVLVVRRTTTLLPGERGLLPAADAPKFVPADPEFPPGVYVGLASRRKADLYATAAWMMVLRKRAAEGDGTLRNVASGAKESLVTEWPATIAETQAWLHTLQPDQYMRLKERLSNLPLYDPDGDRTEWDRPRVASDGRWMVRKPEGVAE